MWNLNSMHNHMISGWYSVFQCCRNYIFWSSYANIIKYNRSDHNHTSMVPNTNTVSILSSNWWCQRIGSAYIAKILKLGWQRSYFPLPSVIYYYPFFKRFRKGSLDCHYILWISKWALDLYVFHVICISILYSLQAILPLQCTH